MSKTKLSEFRVLYPDKEKAYAFVTDDGKPFRNVVVGITYPFSFYNINSLRNRPINVFEYVLEGEGEVFLDGKWQRVRAGEVYVLRANEPHRYRANPENPWKKLWINYAADYISDFLDAFGIKSGVYPSENAREYFERAYEYASSSVSLIDVGYGIADCIHSIIQTVSRERNSEGGDEYRIRDALNCAVYEKIGLDELAERLHMSKSNVIRVFKKSYGITPYEYLISLKISTAKVLLKDTRMTVKEISERLCFSDAHYFSTCFLERVGVRPREYREKHKASLNAMS